MGMVPFLPCGCDDVFAAGDAAAYRGFDGGRVIARGVVASKLKFVERCDAGWPLQAWGAGEGGAFFRNHTQPGQGWQAAQTAFDFGVGQGTECLLRQMLVRPFGRDDGAEQTVLPT